MSGVDVPKLGSVKDKILRDFLLKRASREIAKNKALIMGLMGVIVSNQGPKGTLDTVINHWSNYVNQELFLESVIEEREADMRKEYETWKHVKPKVVLKKNKDGDVAMAVLVSSLSPKIKE